MNSGLLNMNYMGINNYTEYGNDSYNSMEVLLDNIIYKCAEFCTGFQLKELTKTLNKVMKDYELINVYDEETQKDHAYDNNELLKIFLDAKTLAGCSENSIKAYQGTIAAFLDWVNKPLTNIQTEDIRAYIKYKMDVDNISNSYADTILRYLRTSFKWWADEGYVYKNPTASIPKIKSKKVVREPFTYDEIEKLRSVYNNPKSQYYLRNLAIFELLLSSGIRVSELVSLNKNDIDWDQRSFIVLGKGGKERKCFFNFKAKKALEDYLESRTDNVDALFYSKLAADNHRLSINGVERMVRDKGRLAGVKSYPHKFRRTFATNMLRKGTPIEQVRLMLGHENLETTTLYAIVDDEQVQFNHRRLMD